MPNVKGDTRGRTHDTINVGTGATNSVDLDVSALDRVTFLARLAGTVTAGDLTFTAKPYDDKDQLFDQALAAEASVAIAASGADVVGQFSYALREIGRAHV